MSYMRGKYYIFSDDKNMSIYGPEHTKKNWDGERAVMFIPLKTFDELVVMHYAKMGEKSVKLAEKRAIKRWSGNFSCDPLREKYGLKTALQGLIKKI